MFPRVPTFPRYKSLDTIKDAENLVSIEKLYTEPDALLHVAVKLLLSVDGTVLFSF